MGEKQTERGEGWNGRRRACLTFHAVLVAQVEVFVGVPAHDGVGSVVVHGDGGVVLVVLFTWRKGEGGQQPC